jgi:hypothetical protein
MDETERLRKKVLELSVEVERLKAVIDRLDRAFHSAYAFIATRAGPNMTEDVKKELQTLHALRYKDSPYGKEPP